MSRWLDGIQTLCLILFLAGIVRLEEEYIEDAELYALTEEFWQWKCREYPEHSEDHQQDDKLEIYTIENYKFRKGNCSHFLVRARGIDPKRLSGNDQLTLGILKDQLVTFVEGYEWAFYGALSPINFLEGIQRDIEHWTTNAELHTTQDFENYLSRVRAIAQQVDQVIELMRLAIELNRTSHYVSMDTVPWQLSSKFVDLKPEDSMFYTPVFEGNQSLTRGPFGKKFTARLNDVILNSVRPAFIKLKDFIQNVYMMNTRHEHGVWSLERGDEYYRWALRWHLSVSMEPREVHKIGLTEVERIHTEMTTLMRRLKFDGNLPEFFNQTGLAQQFYNHTEDQMLASYDYILNDRITPRLGPMFSNLSDVPRINVQRMPNDGVDAYYQSGTLWANTRRPKTRPSFVMLAIALHEGNPGHHLQVSLSQQLPIPTFRRRLMGGKKYAAPFHFPYYTAYVEGWGLYAEYLGQELNLYTDPYELFGRYIFEMVRACRLVIDTGIHALKWSREQAVHYLMEYTFKNQKQAEMEVDRYITWPGQACAYKIGEIKLIRIRRKAESKLGDAFDLRAFHWQVLRLGFVPIALLEESIDAWLEEQLAAKEKAEQALDLVSSASSSTSSCLRHNTSISHSAFLLLLVLFITRWLPEDFAWPQRFYK